MIIRPITTPEEAEQVVEVEMASWEMDPIYAVPSHILLAVAHNGGLLLGAFKEGGLVGFALGWLGTVGHESGRPAAERLKFCSHIAGVLPGYRDQGIGLQLKLGQRQWVLDQGLDLISWTFDPLESRNANLNFRRLGVICQTYRRDVYGEMPDQINQGIPSDRFLVEWWLTSQRVNERLAGAALPAKQAAVGARLLNPATLRTEDLPQPAKGPWQLDENRVLVEIPPDMQAIRRTDLELGIAWRLHTREIFEAAFSAGYQATDLIYDRSGAYPRSFYLLEHTRPANAQGGAR